MPWLRGREAEECSQRFVLPLFIINAVLHYIFSRRELRRHNAQHHGAADQTSRGGQQESAQEVSRE